MDSEVVKGVNSLTRDQWNILKACDITPGAPAGRIFFPLYRSHLDLMSATWRQYREIVQRV